MHTHHHHYHHDDEDEDFDSNLDDEEYLDAKFYKAVDKRFDEFERKIKEAIAINIDKKVSQKVKEELKGTYTYSPVKEQAPMDIFLKAFLEEYGEWSQVSYNELSHLAVQIHGVSDKRSIQNRINYLIGKGVITEFSPNVYNVIQ